MNGPNRSFRGVPCLELTHWLRLRETSEKKNLENNSKQAVKDDQLMEANGAHARHGEIGGTWANPRKPGQDFGDGGSKIFHL